MKFKNKGVLLLPRYNEKTKSLAEGWWHANIASSSIIIQIVRLCHGFEKDVWSAPSLQLRAKSSKARFPLSTTATVDGSSHHHHHHHHRCFVGLVSIWRFSCPFKQVYKKSRTAGNFSDARLEANKTSVNNDSYNTYKQGCQCNFETKQ